MDRWNPQRYGSAQSEELEGMTRNRKEWNKLVEKAKTHTPGYSAAEEEEEVSLTDPDGSENREAFIVQESISLKTHAEWNLQNVGMCQITYTASRPRRRESSSFDGELLTSASRVCRSYRNNGIHISNGQQKVTSQDRRVLTATTDKASNVTVLSLYSTSSLQLQHSKRARMGKNAVLCDLYVTFLVLD